MKDILENLFYIALIALAIGAVLWLIGHVIWEHNVRYGNEQIIEIEVQDKYTKGKEGTYFVIDSNDNAYEVTDMLWKGKHNSTDIYNKLKIGKKYKVKTTGERIHFWSMYPNINEIIQEIE